MLALVVVLYFWLRVAVKDTGVQAYLEAKAGLHIGSDVGGSPSGQQSKSISRRVVAVADLHGDLGHAHNVLQMTKLIDSDFHWIGGHDVLVSTGDIVDRGDDTIALYRMFDRLRTEAAATGGEVLNCLGNHEIMNSLGDWRYVTRGDVDSFGGVQQRRKAMSSDGWIGQSWLANFNITHTVPLLPLHLVPSSANNRGAAGGRVAAYTVPRASFVHGGITPAYARRGAAAINRIGHSLLQRALAEEIPNGQPPHDTPTEELELYGSEGPLWYRGYANQEDEAQICAEAERAASALGVRHLVMGHTPHLEGFVVRCEGKVLLIDTGISKAYGGEQSALVLETELKYLSEGHDGVSNKWKETQTLTALYKGRRPKVIHTVSREVYLY
ncbi:Metallo-dependent phosphatase [Tilletiaria anomala UBC 951]|uniref:Metallo-dependent phosphatase n=1 Tax=Tilletiaria anomala (strain ATCC 24038 / CBS 436.72 / UBC 951) TaxID=1037660 RepID=A0A066VKA2_TILAU|nr:Metallo-dependent phosphatase [Tilletiaria anomala UBC 951]KDN39015.1 Metallo-dependent phosphatase [Tilletiaria anomala UBC 951]